MNKTYSLIWNPLQQCWQVGSELKRARGKAGSGRRWQGRLLAALGLIALAPAHALPQNGSVVSGNGNILVFDNGKQLSINQGSDKLAINWDRFDIAAGEKVRFNQPGSQSIALNRVLGNNGSTILGQLEANGRVFLINPNGVVFGKGAQVNVGGLVASTQNLSDADFQAGNYRFAGSSTRRIENEGSIVAKDGGFVALLAAKVDNKGTIQAQQGKVALAGGKAFTLNLDNDGLLNLQVDQAAVDAQVLNRGLLRADGGEVLLTASAAANMVQAAVNNLGVIEARALNNRSGKIVLDAGDGRADVAGRLDASAQGASRGDGGLVEVKGGKVNVALATAVNTAASNGRTGNWKISADQLEVSPGASQPAASGVFADTLSRNLANTHIELASRQGDIVVNGPVSWSSGNALTLNASNNIQLNGNLSATGAGGALALNYGGDGYFLKSGVKVTLSGKGAQFDSNGNRYTVIQDVAQLQAINGNLNGLYVLGNAIDGYNRVFSSIAGGGNASFSGVFDGLGNDISRLNIQFAGPSLGLFAANSGIIGNVNLLNSRVNGSSNYMGSVEIGSLVGRNTGLIHNASSNAVVDAYGSRMNSIGGLVGVNAGGKGVVRDSSFNGTVYSNRYTQAIGGLVGENVRGYLLRSQANARVYASSMARNEIGSGGVGGLVGLNNNGYLGDVSAAGSVDARVGLNVGGLVGYSKGGSINNAKSSASVYASNDSRIGGLVGYNEGGSIEGSSASGVVKGAYSAAIGGLVGLNQDGYLSNVNASGQVYDTGSASLGGLIGTNNGGRVVTAAAQGMVTGGANSRVGGLIGSNNTGDISFARASGKVSGGSNSLVGGLVAYNGGNLRSTDASGEVIGGDTSRVGGLVGVNSNSNEAGSIQIGNATGNVRGGSRSLVGGLVGMNESEIDNSVASGMVSGGSDSMLGGLVGMNQRSGTVNYSTASGKISWVNGWRQVYGGLVGWNYGEMRGNLAMGNAALVPNHGRNEGVISAY
ncbi:hypothetical protein VI26_02855 [Chromobacterium sp. LK1]|uniref:two-partner secretion domain-containing protein n=1 Tax=Chromobacterium sp. LK1 TaxID=1628193 RepID=UPI00065346F8|nr:filamentous hemagglutinin N-terminal domain-containing protein [Chromobacterium sp. LK1]KMN37581.1 hypothetical protein VI26_02855 [Chromobacterium sp. LK1]